MFVFLSREFKRPLRWAALAGLSALSLLVCLEQASAEAAPSRHGEVFPESLAPHERESSLVTAGEIRLARSWVERMTSTEGERPEWLDGWLGSAWPFSFQYGDENSESLLKRCDPSREEKNLDSGSRSLRLIWTDPPTGLRVTWEIEVFSDFPALEWVLFFENIGSRDTPIVQDVQALDLRLNSPAKDQPYVVHGALGGKSSSDDLAPFSQALLPYGSFATRRMELGGAPSFLENQSQSSNNHLPFFNIETPDQRGLLVGIGWSGSWRALLNLAKDALHAQVGLKRTHFLLHPGESIRSPRILVALWQGKRLHGQNMFRRLLYEHYVPHLRGKPQKPLVSVNTAFTYKGLGTFLHQAGEKEVLALVEPFTRLGAELFIIDAGWFEGAPWHQWLGNWTVSHDKYPRGFTPISSRLAASGIDFGLWFGPEQATGQAPVAKEHPDLLRQTSENPIRYTVKMERAEAREWLLEQIGTLVREQGLTCYRQDLSGKFGSEAPDREGISESRHVAGLYAYWDTLRNRYPDLIMEGCCAGGRRIDLETISRFHWHQKSDRWFDSESDQLGLYGANLFLPGGVINIPTSATDNYGSWSSFAGQFVLGWDPLEEDFPMEEAKSQVELYKEIRPLLRGDFYPLTPPSLDQPWIGYQFHRRDEDKGMALIFRRGIFQPLTASGHSLAISLRGLRPERSYRVRFRSSNREGTWQGQDLHGGIEVLISTVPGAELITYEPAP